MTSGQITVELIQNESDPHWTDPLQQIEFEKFFHTLTGGNTYHRSVDLRVLKINNDNVALMGEFYIAARDIAGICLSAAILEWLSMRAERKVRVELSGFEVVASSLLGINNALKMVMKNKLGFIG